MAITPYLFFNGNCAEALRFYEQVLGAKIDTIMTFADAPEGSGPPNVDPSKVMHARLVIGNDELLASDDPNGGARGMSGFSLSLVYPTAEEATRVFNALAEGGQVFMPLSKVFWAEAFGMTADRFGVPWMISTEH